MAIHSEPTVGELAARSLVAMRVLEDHGIDFCCGGARPFAEVCRDRRLDPDEVLREIGEATRKEATSPASTDWTAAPLDELIRQIVDRHHTHLRDEMPRLAAWAAAVRRAHGERDGAMLDRLVDVYTAMKEELDLHMRKEEGILFPAILRGEKWIAHPIAMMEHEHAGAGRALSELRELTDGYRLPVHACATYRALYAGLAALEKDLHLHLHLENNILFPRAAAEVKGC